MSNLQEKIDRANKEHSKKIRELTLEQDIRDMIADVLPSLGPKLRRVFLHPLYGSQGTVSFGDSYSAGQCVTIDEARAITEALPPLPMQYLRGTYRYFVPREYADQHEALLTRDKITESYPIAPFKFELDGHGSSVKYFTKLDGDIFTVELNVSTNHCYGALSIRGDIRYYGNATKIRSIDNQCAQHGGVAFRATTVPICDANGHYLTEFADPIQYASGSADTWKRHVLYAHDAAANIGIDDFLTALYTSS